MLKLLKRERVRERKGRGEEDVDEKRGGEKGGERERKRIQSDR